MSVARSPTRSGLGVGRSDSQPNLTSNNLLLDMSGTNRAQGVTLRSKRKLTSDNDAVMEELSEMRKQMSQLMFMLTTLNTNQKESMDNILKDITTIKENVTNIKSTTETLSSNQKSMKLDIENLTSMHLTTEKKLEAVESEMMMLKASAKPSTSPSSPFEEIVAELKDRELRSRNIIIGGVAEPLLKEEEERMNLDMIDVAKIIKAIDPECPEPAKIFRLGKYNPKKIRHLKVCFKTNESAVAVLRNRNLIKNDNIKIFADQTPKQQEHFKQLKDEIKHRTDNGKSQLTIKYIRGFPKIIEYRPKDFRKALNDDDTNQRNN